MRSFRQTLVFSSIVICVFISLSTPPLQCAEAGDLKVGAAKVDITPKDLTGLVSAWGTPFIGVHDPIYARALVLDNGVNTVAIVATDLVEFGDTMSLRQRIQKELGIPVEHIIITATHDHNAPRGGPITLGTSSEQGRPSSTPAYTQFVDDCIAEAVRQAKASMQPARVGVGTGRADINVERNGYNTTNGGWNSADPDGPSDKTVWVVKFESLSGEPIGLLMNYAVHSAIAGSGSSRPLEVAGDLSGATERFVEQHYGTKVVALWTMGAAGDQNPKFGVSLNGKDPEKNKALAYEAIDALGLNLGVEVIETANRIETMTSTARIEAAESVFSCATAPARPRPAGGGLNTLPPNPNSRPTGPAPPPPPLPPPPSMKFHLNLILINQIAITGVSAEIFTKIYLHLKKDSPLTNTIMATMSNDRIGYIADDAAYDGPYSNPVVVRGCAEKGIVNGLVDMMNKHLFQ